MSFGFIFWKTIKNWRTTVLKDLIVECAVINFHCKIVSHVNSGPRYKWLSSIGSIQLLSNSRSVAPNIKKKLFLSQSHCGPHWIPSLRINFVTNRLICASTICSFFVEFGCFTFRMSHATLGPFELQGVASSMFKKNEIVAATTKNIVL